MNRDEAMRILELYRDWNTGQRGSTPQEQEIFDARRAILLKATEHLTMPEAGGES